ncbi:hypothetical protein COO60DRAFT_29441 [Scenedesmus sp. NREL 46B-D3]|nr:hypothetical protein COO60DRAFT_29441 [Scenedesmus sp. NREL 46B-D3]
MPQHCGPNLGWNRCVACHGVSCRRNQHRTCGPLVCFLAPSTPISCRKPVMTYVCIRLFCVALLAALLTVGRLMNKSLEIEPNLEPVCHQLPVQWGHAAELACEQVVGFGSLFCMHAVLCPCTSLIGAAAACAGLWRAPVWAWHDLELPPQLLLHLQIYPQT